MLALSKVVSVPGSTPCSQQPREVSYPRLRGEERKVNLEAEDAESKF